MLRFSNFARVRPFDPPPPSPLTCSWGCNGNVAGIFHSPGLPKTAESSVFWALPALALSVYTTGPISMRTTKRGRGLPPPSAPSRHPGPSRPPSSSLGTSISPYLSLTNIVSLRSSPSPPPAICLSSSCCPSSLRFLPRTPSPSAREAKRRLFRRECFRRNAETVLIAAHLA